MELRDWVLLLTAIVQLITAIIISRRERKKGTKKRSQAGKRK